MQRSIVSTSCKSRFISKSAFSQNTQNIGWAWHWSIIIVCRSLFSHAVHCFLTPFIFTLLPLFGLRCWNDELMHPLLAAFVLTFGLTSIIPGYRKHKECSILFAMLTGLALVLLATFYVEAAFGESWELPVITLGNALVISAHFFNRRQLSKLTHSPA